jgi:nicotinamidase-related amidase
MENLKFDKEITALLVIDPYKDFISDGGKLWDRLKAVAEANNCVPHMLQILSAARNRAAQQRSARLAYVLESERTQLLTEIDNRIESNLSRKPPVFYSTPL